jgi:hypothetical protein
MQLEIGVKFSIFFQSHMSTIKKIFGVIKYPVHNRVICESSMKIRQKWLVLLKKNLTNISKNIIRQLLTE